MTDKDEPVTAEPEAAPVAGPKTTLVKVAQSKISLLIRVPRHGLREGNATWCEYFRTGGEFIGADNGSDGTVRLRDGKYSFRVGEILFGEYDTPQAAELEHQLSGGFCSLATFRRITMLAKKMQPASVNDDQKN